MADLLNTRDVPPGGWRYTERATGHRFTAVSYERLLEQVRAHREYKGLPLDTLVRDVDDQICLRLSCADCRPRPGETYEPVNDRTAALTVPMVASLNAALISFLRQGAQFVDPAESESRAAVCRTCPFNIPASSCSCHAAYKLIELLIPRKTEGVSVCSACGCSLQAKAVLPDQVLIDSTAPGTVFPPWCWQRTLLSSSQKTDTQGR